MVVIMRYNTTIATFGGNMNSRFGIILTVIVLGFLGVIILGKRDTTAPGAPTTETAGTVSNYIYGNKDAAVTLVEYGDFECPACGAYYPIVKEIKEKYKDQISFQFRNFPLSSIHPNAMAAHRAAVAADKQGKFWEMHDLIYETQTTWNASSGTKSDQATTIFEGYASRLGLDQAKYKSDRDAASTNATIQADVKAGKDVKAESTPTFYVNGVKIENPQDAAAFDKVIQDAIAAKKQAN